MQSLFVKFLIAFWLVIGAIIGVAAAGGFLYAEKLQQTIEDFEVGDSMLDASAALAGRGRAGLTEWMEKLPRNDGVIVYIVDETGDDLLGRRIPFAVERVYQRHKSRLQKSNHGSGEPRGSRRSRIIPQLVGGDGSVYTMLVAPLRTPEAFWSNSDGRFLLLVFALLASGLVSYVLAAAFSRPVRKLRDATLAIADGNLDIRVADSIGKRRDELGMLGRDFDLMAEKLQHAAEQQTELSRNISHELRSPLARMRVAVELARRKAGELSEFARLDDEAERLDGLIGQILAYTRLETDPQRSATPVDLCDVISEVVENVNFESRQDRRVLFDAGPAVIIPGHREALVSAIENVVRNAARHAPADASVDIELSTTSDSAIIRVIDSGPGVAEDDLPHLFEPFYRTRSSAETDGSGGTGLGLAIARRAVELHRGHIEARNHEDGGLVVTITLLLG